MAGKTANWKPGPTVCRCCLAEGCYKDISTEYFWMGKREVYAEMLTNTFNVSIAFSQSGGPNSNSRLICEPCISRLRDASNFKRQVLDCEKTFMQHLDPGSSLSHQDLPEELAGLDDAVKVERVKIERDAPSDDDFDATPDFLDDDDDELDQPLTNFATKEPKKEAVSLLEELLDNPAVTIKKKSVVKTKQPPAKKVKRTETAKPTSSKVVVKTATAEKKKKGDKEKKTLSEAQKLARKEDQERNMLRKRQLEVLAECSTIFPFRWQKSKYLCFWCHRWFTDPALLKEHTSKHLSHPKRIQRELSASYFKEFIKVDVVDIRCRLCVAELASLSDLVRHLESEHGKKDLNADHLLPFKLDKEQLKCVICSEEFNIFSRLSQHMNTHFANFFCDQCGMEFASATRLHYHSRCHQKGEFECEICKKVFNTKLKKDRHYTSSHLKAKQHRCVHCSQMFCYYAQKLSHIREVHGINPKVYTCNICSDTFNFSSSLSIHRRKHKQ